MSETANIQRTGETNLTPVLPRPRLTGDEIRELAGAPAHVYFIYSGGLIKIGYSSNWVQRLEDISQGCPHPAEMILVMPGDREMEAGYHKLFAEYRMNREWFRCEGKMRDFLMHFSSPEGRENLELAEQSFALTEGENG